MNNKLAKILGVVATLTMLASMLTVTTPALAADPLKWETESGPSSTSTGSQINITGADVTDFAVADDGTTVYAVSNGATKMVLKSTNSGSTWSRLNSNAIGTVTSANLANPMKVAVAPGDANTAMIVGSNSTGSTKILITSDGGNTFSELTGFGATLVINDIAISPLTSGVRYVTLAGNDGAGDADVQYFPLGSLVSQWTSIKTSTSPDNWQASDFNGSNVLAVAFSPNFSSDRVLMAVTTNATPSTSLEILSFSSKKINTAAGFLNYPKLVVAAASTAAQIAVPATFLGADDTLRTVFVGATAGGSGDVFRLQDSGTARTAMGFGVDIASVAYNGSVLVAGAATGTNVFSCANPTAAAAAITFTTTSTYQKPGGANTTLVAWAGTNVVAGTAGANSAYAVSKDNGVTFNDVSLVDWKIGRIFDIAVAADGKTVYSVSDDNATATQLNVWRKSGTTWERVLSIPVASTLGYKIRVAPENAANVYLFNTAGTDMFYSNDSGEKTWQLRSMIEAPIDAAVESAQVVYTVTAAAKVFKSVNAGFTWDSGVSTGLTDGASTISVVKANQIIVGGGGDIAYSTDGSASATTWKRATGIYSSAAVFAVADKLETGGFIYTASGLADQSVKRRDFAGTDWKDIQADNATGVATGIALRGGVLYTAVYSSANVTYLSRILEPAKAVDTTVWSTFTANLWASRPVFIATADADNKLWVINSSAGTVDGAGDSIKSFMDSVAKSGPAPTAPADKATLTTNPVTGRAEDVAFSWPRLSLSTAYRLQISLDANFTQLIKDIAYTPSPSTTDPVVAVLGPYQTGAANYSFAPGTTYYWRVEATTPLQSVWSTARTFTWDSLTPFELSSPTVGQADVPVRPILNWTAYTGAIWYEVTVSEDPSFAIPEFSHNVTTLFYGITADEALKYNTTYYWRVRGVTAEPYVSGTKVITPAGPYMTGAFTTMAEPAAEPTGPAVITVPGPAQVITMPAPPPQTIVQEQPIPSWMLLTIIVIGAILVIALIVLIVRTRRVA